MRLVVAITGASGVIYGIRTLEVLKRLKVDTHLIITEWGDKNIKIETDKTADYVKSLATRYYEDYNMAAPVSSGSFRVDGMIVIPCSTKTLASIANALDDSLVSRAAGVCIKEQRKLVLVPRETPLSKIHLKNMTTLASTNAVILPAMPGFYHRPKTMDDLINDNEARLLYKEANLAKCAKKIMSGGSKFVIIKKGENGAILFTKEGLVFPAAAFFLDEIVDPTGAGDSFAGGFLGHIARKGMMNFTTMKEAVIYGNVMGSFAVEDFGIKRLLSITKDDVEDRYEKYCNLVQF